MLLTWLENFYTYLIFHCPLTKMFHRSALTPVDIMNAIIIFTWIVYAWETYLSYRQYKVLKNTRSVPPELSGVIDQETFTKSRLYNLERAKFGLVSSLWEQLFQTAVLVLGGIPFLWALSGKATGHFGYGGDFEKTQTLVFSLIGSIITTLMDLPWRLYSTFVIEERHGFNKQSIGFFFKDLLKKFVVMHAIALPILALIIYIVRTGGDYFFVYLWAFCVVLTLVFVTVYADFIAPLFDKYDPLPEGELKNKIEALAESINFPLKKLYVVDGSKRSSHSNAYLYGFYKNKRVVLFDTLIADYVSPDKKEEETKEGDKPEGESSEKKKTGCNNEEILSVLAHEFGHWKLNHTVKNMIISQVNLFLSFAVFALLYKEQMLYTAFGFPNSQPLIVGIVIIFQYVFSPYNEVMQFLFTVLSRRFEFQADAFAKLMHRAADLRSSLIKLNQDNLGFPVHDWLYSAWHHSHPPLLQRIKALGKLD